MKFGTKISNDLYNEWRPFYLDYNGLKRDIKARTTSHGWNAKDEREFTAMLEKELDKIHGFQKEKVGTSELSRRIRDAENSVQKLVTETREEGESSPQPSPVEEETQQRQSYPQDGGSDDELSDDEDEESLDALEERFHELEEEVATLVADVHDLALYAKLNLTGFMKILKKHDKQTDMTLKPTFIQDYLEKRPFYKYNWDALIVKLSKLYDLVRTRGHPVQGDSSAGGSQSAFIRQTTKYWVHPDNLVPLKLAILRHLPVLVFDANKEFEPSDAAITSIYFDNEELDLYLGRLEKTEGAEAIRLRWYGGMGVKTIFVERKTHREDWTGEKSVKARFPLKEHLVNPFLRGEYTVDEDFQQLVVKGKKTQQEVDAMIQLANQVQYAVLTRKLRPVMRSFYNRTAFQLPGDARVRISLDTELSLIREDNWSGRQRAGDNWRRTDIGIDHPFDQVHAEDKELFKYGVLEVKLQTHVGQQPPTWVTDLVQSHLVEAVPKFSKFIHGCATLLPSRVDLVPFWLPQMETDILKPDTGYLTVIERPTHSAFKSGSERPSPSTSSSIDTTPYAEPVSEGEEDDMELTPARDEGKRTGLDVAEANAAVEYRNKMLKEQGQLNTTSQAGEQETAKVGSSRALENKPQALSINPLAPSSAFDETLKKRLNKAKADDRQQDSSPSSSSNGADEGPGLNSSPPDEDRIISRDFAAPVGKLIAVPVRIEPKVYFAAERTFLKWINVAVTIGSIATTLLNFIPPEDTRGLISAALFTLAALLAIAYSGGIFVFRTLKIRQRSAEGLYYDKYGPTVLCFALFLALATNIGLRVSQMAKEGEV
ncbi:SPX-domain-containing protein [Pluteus cervinus]|uniref:SPX-domain-containing protein n=1 Tax=Pluteus cervinus TaxID=181527 RepID=A0ACD3AX84_9AGAR|nr:SPX-domain-containing protein [Pluteus cervinus]